jgi:excisionase family DNA binding protein
MNHKNSHSQQFSSQTERNQNAPEDNGNGTSPNGEHLLIVSAGRVLLTAEEVAEILRVPRSWIYGHLDQLPTVRLGRYVRFKRSEIELFLDQQKAC